MTNLSSISAKRCVAQNACTAMDAAVTSSSLLPNTRTENVSLKGFAPLLTDS